MISTELTPPQRLSVFDDLICQGVDDPIITDFAAVATKAATDPTEALRQLLATVQRMVPYTPDPPGGDWVQPVTETLATGGDCEDLASLLVALIRSTARHWPTVKARLVWLYQPGSALDHVTVQASVDNGVAWLWAEPALNGALLGEHPYEALVRLGAKGVIYGAV